MFRGRTPPVVRERGRRVAFALLILMVIQGTGASSALGQGNNQQRRSVKEILADPQLWAKDFPTVLANISSWAQVEQRIAIFPTRALGTTPYRTSAEAERVGAILRSSLRPNDQQKASVVPWFEDDSFRVVVGDGEMQLLPRNLSLETVKKRLGQPESVTPIAITGNTERRPVVLLLYSYAGGAVVYAEDTYSPVPGMVNRVFLDVNSVIRAMS